MAKAKTVTVGCKLPNGLILEVDGKTVELSGANSSVVVGGHGITRDVDAALWDAWLKEHSERDMVKNGFVFAHEKIASTNAEAEEKSDNKTKLEPMAPDDKANGVQTKTED